MKIEDIDKTWDLFSRHDRAKKMLEGVNNITDIGQLMRFIGNNRVDIKLPQIEELKKITIAEVNKLIKGLEDEIKSI